jgi:hypothetical protein
VKRNFWIILDEALLMLGIFTGRKFQNRKAVELFATAFGAR